MDAFGWGIVISYTYVFLFSGVSHDTNQYICIYIIRVGVIQDSHFKANMTTITIIKLDVYRKKRQWTHERCTNLTQEETILGEWAFPTRQVLCLFVIIYIHGWNYVNVFIVNSMYFSDPKVKSWNYSAMTEAFHGWFAQQTLVLDHLITMFHIDFR